VLLKEATKTLAYGKVGIFGFQGSGKTYTASLIAVGLCKMMNNDKIAYFDTETGSDWLIDKLKGQGMRVFQVKSRAFNDLVNVIKECEQNDVGVLIIDSITHVWRELTDSYKTKLNRRRLQFPDWEVIKKEWQRYTDAFVNSKLHIIVCGRAGYEYDFEEMEEGEKKELVKTGTKMKAEGEFGFEPSLVIEMERIIPGEKKKLKKGENSRVQQGVRSKFIHRAYILKDRADLMNGEIIDNPTFDDLAPHFNTLNLGGEHIGVDTTRTSEHLFDVEGKPQWKKEKERKEIELEELQIDLDRVFPGSTTAEKQARRRLLEYCFGTAAKSAIEAMSRLDIELGRNRLKLVLSNPQNIETLLSKEGGEMVILEEEALPF
jgi:hypothetical protein